MDCTPVCRLASHADVVLSAVTREQLDEIKCFVKYFCGNGGRVCDSFGRNAVHVAASCGKKDVLKWLIEQGQQEEDWWDYWCQRRRIWLDRITPQLFLWLPIMCFAPFTGGKNACFFPVWAVVEWRNPFSIRTLERGRGHFAPFLHKQWVQSLHYNHIVCFLF